jgi:hypothetical protein
MPVNELSYTAENQHDTPAMTESEAAAHRIMIATKPRTVVLSRVTEAADRLL